MLLLVGLVLMPLTQASLAKLPDPPSARSRQDVEKVLAQVPKQPSEAVPETLNVVLVADKKDHGPYEHDYPLWQQRWEILLSGRGEGPTNLYGPPQAGTQSSDIGTVTVKKARGWPNKAQLDWADVVVVFCYIEWDEQKLYQLQAYLKRGGGYVPLHSATWTKPRPSAQVAALTGGGGFAQFRHGPLTLKIVDPDHPICLGLPQEIEFLDESYWPPTPESVALSMHVLASSDEKPSKTSASRQAQPMFWTYPYGKGRVFGCVLGHYTWTFDDPYFRLLLMRGIAWSAGQWPYKLDELVTHGIVLKD